LSWTGKIVGGALGFVVSGGNVIGAAIGVRIVHLEGVVFVAQKLMGGTLWFVSIRFLWDVVKLRRAKARGHKAQA